MNPVWVDGGQVYDSDKRRFRRADIRMEGGGIAAICGETPPAPGGALFIGSSSIRMWDLAKHFPAEENAINRGFGGSHMADSTH